MDHRRAVIFRPGRRRGLGSDQLRLHPRREWTVRFLRVAFFGLSVRVLALRVERRMGDRLVGHYGPKRLALSHPIGCYQKRPLTLWPEWRPYDENNRGASLPDHRI